MILKKFQRRALDEVQAFLDTLAAEKRRGNAKHAAADAWEGVGGRGRYRERRDGLGRDLPTFCVKVPTGGGKTLLATHILGLVHSMLLRERNGTGLAVWVVPSDQIYRDTLAHLRDRRHPYRESLEFAVSGRVEMWGKHEIHRMTPGQLRGALNVLLVVLASTNRETKEQLKFFRDSGGNIVQHFPPEDRPAEHAALLGRVPNLDRLGDDLVATSLANLVRLCEPVVVLDEGHKATSDLARRTIEGMNPALVFELSATPPKDANKLVVVTGQELLDEEMIKLPINVSNSRETSWEACLAKAQDRRNRLANLAERHHSGSGTRIRPIVLVQVERTGKDQRDGKLVHAEDVREHLVQRLGVASAAIAVKSAVTDELERIDLLDEGCSVEWIITKAALQEGWDCPFAYVLVSLSAGKSGVAMTQLVGRILRQPNATRTGIRELDESYVYCLRQSATEVVKDVKAALEREGYEGTLSGVVDRSDPQQDTPAPSEARILRKYTRHYLRPFEGKIFLPRFCVKTVGGYERLDYFQHLVSRVAVEKFRYEEVPGWRLGAEVEVARHEWLRITLGKEAETGSDEESVPIEGDEKVERWLASNLPFDHFSGKDMASVARAVLCRLLTEDPTLRGRLGLVKHPLLTRVRGLVERETDRQTEEAFREMHRRGQILFYLQCVDCRFQIPARIEVRSTARLNRDDGRPLQKSLFDFVPAELNDYEKAVALVLDSHPQVLWWYRNLVGEEHFSIQGFRKPPVYPDFVVQTAANGGKPAAKVLVIESKGTHLKGSEDTRYKKDLALLFDECGREVSWQELSTGFAERKFRFQVLDQGDYTAEEWRDDLDSLVREA
ncbi:MAG: DEAD/DEAH box helicase family protein [Planctomycetota bacterium]